jgi:plasmid stability protein
MTTLTIRNVEPVIKDKLRMAAAANGRSMEEEVRIILRNVLAQSSPSSGLGSHIHARFAALPKVGKTSGVSTRSATGVATKSSSPEWVMPKRTHKPRAAKFDQEAHS